jgi:hypothetical protein
MIRRAHTGDTVLDKGREMRGIGAKHCRGGCRRGKDDRKQNTLALLNEHHPPPPQVTMLT